MLGNTFRREEAKDINGRGSGGILRPPSKELKSSAMDVSCSSIRQMVPPTSLSGERGLVLLLIENVLQMTE